jgi:outer membrane receptor protein involved in Fe transport
VGLGIGASFQVSAQTSGQTGAGVLPVAANDSLAEVVVTARKQTESIVDVPTSITAIGPEAIKEFDIQSFADYGTKIPNLNFTYGQGGLTVTNSMTIAIRGISGVNTTGFYIDDTPVPDTINPRVIDIERIESLKGPQGTLYGAASMGGNVRLITKKPDVDSSDGDFTIQGGGTSGAGSPDYGGSAIGNFVAIPGTLGIRVMGFYQHDGGFLTNTFPSPSGSGTDSSGDQGAIRTYGGSVSARWKISDNFDATLRFLDQESNYFGLREAFAPLPEFLPVYNLPRTVDYPEGATNKFSLASLDLEYRADAFTLTSATSFFYNASNETENGTEGTVETIDRFYGVELSLDTPLPYSATGYTNQFTEEARISGKFTDWLSGIAGLYYNQQWGSNGIPTVIVPGLAANALYPTDLLYDGVTWAKQRQEAAFGELYYKFLRGFTLTLGGRLYYLKESFVNQANGFFNGGLTNSGEQDSSQTGFSPKVALSYATSEHSNLYASYSSGFRPGGPQIPPPPFCAAGGIPLGNLSSYQSDKVDTSEVGFKSDLFQQRAFFSIAVFQTSWKNMQQAVILPCGYGITENTGESRIRGGELEFNGEVVRDLQVRAGLGLLNAVITEKGAGSLQDGERIFQVPKVNGTLGLVYSFPRAWNGRPFVSADYSYIGNRISANNTGPMPLQEPGYALVNMNLGIDFGKSEVSLYAKNLINAKPNAGDIQQIAFPQSLPGPNGTSVPYLEVAVLPPFSFGLQYKYHF